jgi:hypothetical protein
VSKGRIHRILRYLEERHTSFAVSRLIMASGVPVRKYGPESDDNEKVIAQIRLALRGILSETELQRMRPLFEEEEGTRHEKLAGGGRA